MSELTTSTRTFVYGLADVEGRLAAEPLYAAAEAAGFSDTKLRLTLRRMAESGLLRIDGRGRRAEISLTRQGLDDRAPDMIWIAAAHRADRGLDVWDGHWHLAAFEVPEARRAARDALRGQIVELFGAPLGGGIYTTTFPWEPWLVRLARAHGVRDRLTLASTTQLDVGGVAAPRDMAARLWPVAELAADYRAFVDRWSPLLGDVPDDEATAVRLTFEMTDELEAIARRDPVLPAELVPDDFAGPAARRLFVDAARELAVHPVLARASLVGAYESAIESALAQSADTFWTAAYAATAPAG